MSNSNIDYINDAIDLSEKWHLPNGESFENSKSIKIDRIAVIGAGTMGRGIAFAFAVEDFDVVVIEENEKMKVQRETEFQRLLDDELLNNRITQLKHKLIKQKTYFTTDFDQLKNVDLVVEAVFEKIELKQRIFEKLDKLCPKHAILGTNTSSLNIDELASVTDRPTQVIGIHFLTPAHLKETVEVVFGRETSGDTVASVFSILKKIKKIAILVKNGNGFLVNRMQYVYYDRLLRLMSDYGLHPHQVDRLFESFGISIGPIRFMDLCGLDICAMVRNVLGYPKNDLLQHLVDSNWVGEKSGKGFYDHTSGTIASNKVTDQLIDDMAKQKTLMSNENDQLNFVLHPMAVEGQKCIDEKVIESAMLIDLFFVKGVHWSIDVGGPMRWASQAIRSDKKLE